MHLCNFATSSALWKRRAKIATKPSSNTLADGRNPCCRNRRLPPLLRATVKYKEYMLLHYLDTDSSWRKGEIDPNSGHRGWPQLSASSKSSPLHKVVNILWSILVQICTTRSAPCVPEYLHTFTSRRDGSAAGGGRLHTCSGTDRIHLRYSSRRTSWYTIGAFGS